MIKRFHEAPKSIFKRVQKWTDGDYALVHLFEENPEYLELFKEAKEQGREIILDNSIFELGEAFDMDRFMYWVKELKPAYFIVPDSLENTEQTIQNMEKFLDKYLSEIPEESKIIGVVQGKTWDEIVRCYRYMSDNKHVAKIAIPFDFSYYQEIFPHHNKLVSWSMGRVAMLGRLMKEDIINTDKPHHLLGCALAYEFKHYDEEHYEWIDSVDTSLPVTCGMGNIHFSYCAGNARKPKVKLFERINEEVSKEQLKRIGRNIYIFKRLCSLYQY